MQIEFEIVTEQHWSGKWQAEVQMKAVAPATSGRDKDGFPFSSSKQIVGWHTVIYVNSQESESAARTEAFNEFYRKLSS